MNTENLLKEIKVTKNKIAEYENDIRKTENVRLTIMTKEEEIKLLKIGNTQLIGALMGMVHQYFHFNDKTGRFSHSFMSAEECAIEILQNAGFATEDENGFILEYSKLEERQEEELNQEKSK